MIHASEYHRIERLKLAILDSKPGTDERHKVVKQAIHASLGAANDGLSLREIEELCDRADATGVR